MCYHTSYGGKVERSERNLIMIRNLGQQRNPECVRKGRRFSRALAIARETTAVTLENIVALNRTLLYFSNAADAST